MNSMGNSLGNSHIKNNNTNTYNTYNIHNNNNKSIRK